MPRNRKKADLLRRTIKALYGQLHNSNYDNFSCGNTMGLSFHNGWRVVELIERLHNTVTKPKKVKT